MERESALVYLFSIRQFIGKYTSEQKKQGPQGNVWPKLYLYVFNVFGDFNTQSTLNPQNHTQTLDFILCAKVRPSFFLSASDGYGFQNVILCFSSELYIYKYIYIYIQIPIISMKITILQIILHA